MYISAEATTATKTCKIKGKKRQFDDSNQKHRFPLTVTGRELTDTFGHHKWAQQTLREYSSPRQTFFYNPHGTCFHMQDYKMSCNKYEWTKNHKIISPIRVECVSTHNQRKPRKLANMKKRNRHLQVTGGGGVTEHLGEQLRRSLGNNL